MVRSALPLSLGTLSILAVILISLFHGRTCAAVPAPPQDYQNLVDMYDWLTDHELERREIPSMRLRFGKRNSDGLKGMWTVEQRSMPSLRLRFGKRNGEEVGWEHNEVERRAAPSRLLRFGKREALPQQKLQSAQNDNNLQSSPADH